MPEEGAKAAAQSPRNSMSSDGNLDLFGFAFVCLFVSFYCIGKNDTDNENNVKQYDHTHVYPLFLLVACSWIIFFHVILSEKNKNARIKPKYVHVESVQIEGNFTH